MIKVAAVTPLNKKNTHDGVAPPTHVVLAFIHRQFNLQGFPGSKTRDTGWEDLLEKEMVTHSSILVWKIP